MAASAAGAALGSERSGIGERPILTERIDQRGEPSANNAPAIAATAIMADRRGGGMTDGAAADDRINRLSIN